jgi:hypothetical protein
MRGLPVTEAGLDSGLLGFEAKLTIVKLPGAIDD